MARRAVPAVRLRRRAHGTGVAGLPYFADLYLAHWPDGGLVRVWTGMERCRELGLARSIGVSNFGLS